MTISTQHTVEQELAVLAARGAARVRQSGKLDPLASAVTHSPLGYRAVQRMFAEAMPCPEFAFSFFRTVLGRTADTGSIAEWSKLYLRYGLWDLDADGAAKMMLLLGNNMLRLRRAGATLGSLIAYPFWALITALIHPTSAMRIALNSRYWIELARAQVLQPTVPKV